MRPGSRDPCHTTVGGAVFPADRSAESRDKSGSTGFQAALGLRQADRGWSHPPPNGTTKGMDMTIENGEHRSENAGAAGVLHDVDTPSAETDEEVTVHRLGGRGVYSATIAGREIASLLYREEPGLIVVLSTDVDPDFRGRGIAGDLIADALDDIRSRGMKVRAVCPVVAAFMASSVLFSDLAV